MATTPLERVPQADRAGLPSVPPGILRMPPHAVCATLLAVLGVSSIWPTVLFLVDLWRTDPLKSIGAFVAPISLFLILRVWRALGWENRGTVWGLVLLAATILLVHWRDKAVLELVLSPSWSVFLPPHSLVALAYVSGMVLLFGGAALYRAAWFPILFIMLVNPVPHVFNRWIDLPLQHASAVTARAFAQALGQRLTPGELFLMFTPKFGMFIAPGCNGIRGSVTMGLIALIASYLYRFRLRVGGVLMVSAVLLGYVFNLLRLCVLVLYYVVALHWPWLQSWAETGDYIIGATLFFGATVLVFTAISRWSPAHDLRPPPPRITKGPSPRGGGSERAFWSRCGALGGLIALGSFAYLPHATAGVFTPPDQAVFPAQIGPYTLQRSWQEKLDNGTTLFDWAAYRSPGSDTAVEVGVSPVLGGHDTLLCHTARGEDWLWHEEIVASTAAGLVPFSASLYDYGATKFLEASTICSGEHCGQWSHAGRHLGLVYSRADLETVLGRSSERPIPVLLKVEMPEGSINSDAARLQLQGQLQEFLRQASLPALTKPYRLR